MFRKSFCKAIKKFSPLTKSIVYITYIVLLSILSYALWGQAGKLCYLVKYFYYRNSDSLYLVIDLSGGPSAEHYPFRLTHIPPDVSKDICRTTELWLRHIPAGTFLMGSPTDELGRSDDELQHKVTLTEDFFIGIFPCTQKQYKLVMGENHLSMYKGDDHPSDSFSYIDLRGEKQGNQWPAVTEVDENSFLVAYRLKRDYILICPLRHNGNMHVARELAAL